MTQLELAEKISYSDKAVSRWENGESLPDVETLYRISEVFNVPVAYLFEKHDEKSEQMPASTPMLLNKIIITALACSVVWMIALISYVYLKHYNSLDYWQIFVWAAPVSAIVLIYCNKFWGKKVFAVWLWSAFLWSLTTAIYCHFIKYNIWLLFLVAAVMQAIIIVNSLGKPMRKRNKPYNSDSDDDETKK